MFAKAVAKARGFTRPVATSMVTARGQLMSTLGAFVVVNPDGWILTANHIVEPYNTLPANKQKFADHQPLRHAIENNPGLLSEQKRSRLRKLGDPPPDAIKDFGFWWGQDGCVFREAHVIPEVDLALRKLDHFGASGIAESPRFKDPTKGIDPGTFLCRLGFPFTEVKHAYDSATGQFSVDTSTTVFFPNEGMFTRTITVSANPLVGYLETSTPGLKGQSGRPCFDKEGTVWAIQSRTGHLALGFSPQVPGGKPGQLEHQFLNVGRGDTFVERRGRKAPRIDAATAAA